MHGDLCKHLGIESSTDHPEVLAIRVNTTTLFPCGNTNRRIHLQVSFFVSDIMLALMLSFTQWIGA